MKNMETYRVLIDTENGKKDFADFTEKIQSMEAFTKIDAVVKRLSKTKIQMFKSYI